MFYKNDFRLVLPVLSGLFPEHCRSFVLGILEFILQHNSLVSLTGVSIHWLSQSQS